MSFYSVVEKFRDFDYDAYFEGVTLNEVRKSIYEESPSYEDLLNLLSPKAEELLEEMAQRASTLTLQYFGKSIGLYTPMYIANYCVNNCAYCGYGVKNKIHRKQLTEAEIEIEALEISKMGFKHLLVLTGESEYHTPSEYVINSIKSLSKTFPSIGIEIYPMTEEDYSKVVEAGADSLTVYQEVYNEKIYDKVHISGPKKNYKFRLDAPERGLKAGMRVINIGALLGLNEFRREAFMTAMHGRYLRDKYNHVELSYSLPRIRPFGGEFNDIVEITDKNMVQVLLAFRIFQKNVGINMSTRERAEFRENLLPLGVTKVSAGVSTEVGGHSSDDVGAAQFDISDHRSVEEIKEMLISKGYQPVFRDWVRAQG
ncbi:MAG: 2-iminoacetate synthase ThiH [Clostridium sp.]